MNHASLRHYNHFVSLQMPSDGSPTQTCANGQVINGDTLGHTNGLSNEVFETYGLPKDMTIGSNTAGSHPSSKYRPVQHEVWDQPHSNGYVVSPHMINEPPPGRPFRIIMLGAGAAGIDFLHSAPVAFAGTDIEFICYDRNEDIGGTWYENRYPGCACDIPSVGYVFPWKANPKWTSFYSTSQEIWQYMKDIVVEEDMMQYIRLNTQCLSAVWSEATSKWKVRLSKKTTANDASSTVEWEEECDVILNGTGFLKYVLTVFESAVMILN